MKKVAFICVHNSCRSQIAEALGRLYLKDKYECYSAGSMIKDRINPDALRIMRRMYGIDMEAMGQRPKLINEIPECDLLISMGCNVTCPFMNRAFDDDWGLRDPSGMDDEVFEEVIKEIERRIRVL